MCAVSKTSHGKEEVSIPSRASESKARLLPFERKKASFDGWSIVHEWRLEKYKVQE